MIKAWKPGDRIELDLSFAAQTVSDKPDGFIAGFASTPSTDLFGHRVLKGAFDASIKKKGLTGPRGVKLLAHHDWHKPAGVIQRLQTVNDNLEIEAQLNLNVSYVRDLYEAAKQNGGLNYSVGFMLEDFEFVDEDQEKEEKGAEPDYWLIIKQGDLMEVSVVVFPAQLEAEMTFVKNDPPNTLAEFEKALIANGLCRSRSEAKRLTQAVKASAHLFQGKVPPVVVPASDNPHPWLDASVLKAAVDLTTKAKAILGSR